VAHERAASRGSALGLLVRTESRPGVLHQLTGVIARLGGDITWVVILGGGEHVDSVFFEIRGLPTLAPLRRWMPLRLRHWRGHVNIRQLNSSLCGERWFQRKGAGGSAKGTTSRIVSS